MDQENKFNSIVKEIDKNLTKAKEKLSGKASVSGALKKFPTVGFESAGSSYTKIYHKNLTQVLQPDIFDLNMSSDYNTQLQQLQEQINYQNRTIEKLQNLVTSLNNERNFHKEQISDLKEGLDRLADKTSNQSIAYNTERQISAMKRELMHEIEKVKLMLQSYAEETCNSKRSAQSPLWNEDLWTVKDNLTENLGQVQREINAMSRRIDKLEAPVDTEHFERTRDTSVSKNVHYMDRFQRPPPQYTPLYKNIEEINNLDLQQLRQTVNSLNSKLDGIEKKIETIPYQQPLATSHKVSGKYSQSCLPTSYMDNVLDSENGYDDDAHSISDLSVISSLSGNNSDESINALISDLDVGTSMKQHKRPALKAKKTQKENLDLSFSDSDIDDVDLETDILDLD